MPKSIVMQAMTGQDLRIFMRQMPSPVVVVTASAQDEVRGMTVGSFTSVSLDPPLIGFNVTKHTRMHQILLEATHFAVHLLAYAQAGVATHFASVREAGAAQFAQLPHHEHESGIPILEETLGVLICKPFAFHEAGDSVVVLGEVQAVEMGKSAPPLLYYHRQYQTLKTTLD